MAILKKSELKHINEQQLKEKLQQLRKELIRINAQRVVGTAIENPGLVKETRRTIAHIIMLLNKIKKSKKKPKEAGKKE